MTIPEKVVLLNEKELALIELLRKIPFGKVTVFMENNLPIRVEEVRESIKL